VYLRLTIIGIGYVGLVTAAFFAEMSNTITCVDTDVAKIEGLPKIWRKRGEIQCRRVVSAWEIRKMMEKGWPLQGREMGNSK
jgi:UDP-N-acetyl-D-mannosaminuronate dehydrogenase